MKIEVMYELPVFSSGLEEDPIIKTKDLDMEIELIGKDENEQLRKIIITFHGVFCNQHTSARFTPKLYDSYDKVVELVDSEWIMELKRINEDDFNYWRLKHYAMYLDSVGMFQFIAQSFEVREYDSLRCTQ